MWENDDKSRGKLFVKSTFIFKVPCYTAARSCFRTGLAFKSPPLYVEGCPFKILFYPNGRNEAVQSRGEVSLFVKNDSSKEVDAAYSLHILQQYQPHPLPRKIIGFSYDDRLKCREVLTLEPDYQTGKFYFAKRDTIEDPNNYYLLDNCLRIRLTVGVFIDDHTVDSSDDRYIFFQLEMESDSGKRRRYFADESVVLSQCPRLLPLDYRYDRDILISDIKDDVFEAVLWFIYNKKLHNYDRDQISKSDPSEPDSYASRILAAADRFDMERFRGQCQSVISGESIISGETEEHGIGLFYKIISKLGKLLGGADRLLELDSSNNKKNV